VAHGVEERRGKERMIDEAAPAIVRHQRIDRLHLDPAEAGVVHGLQLAVEALRGDGGAEPPPAHHRPRRGGRLRPHPAQIRQRIDPLHGGERHRREHDDHEPPPAAPNPCRVPHAASKNLPPRRREDANARAGIWRSCLLLRNHGRWASA
jgi:hypothetical protein